MVDPNYVAKEGKLLGKLNLPGPIDQKSGGLTGTDTLGALWYGNCGLLMIPFAIR